MKKIYCNPSLFELHQRIYIVDEEKNKVDCIAITNMTELPKALASICAERDIPYVDIECAKAVKKGIVAQTKNYFNKFYSNKQIIIIDKEEE